VVGVLRDHNRIHLLRRIPAKYSMLTRLGTKASATVALRSAIGAVYEPVIVIAEWARGLVASFSSLPHSGPITFGWGQSGKG
jgi:hypothetical protein